MDPLSTLVEALGLAAPDPIQGNSFWPLIRGAPCVARDAIFAEKTLHTAYDPMRCIRTSEHKYIHNFGDLRHHEIPADGEMDCLAAVPDLCRERRPLTELYDLRADPLEMHNLAGRAEHRELESALRERLRGWMVETDDPLLEGVLPIPRFL